MKKRVRLIAIMVAAIMVLSVLAACTPAQAPATTTAAPETTTAAPTTAAPTTAAPETTTEAATTTTEAATTTTSSATTTTTTTTTTTEEAPPEPVTVRFIHIWPEHGETMDKSVQLIEQTYGFNIALSVVPWNEIIQVTQTQVAAGDMYDVYFTWGGLIPGYLDIDIVLDITPWFDADPAWKDTFIYPHVFEEMSFEQNGRIYGIPFRGTGSFMIYNKKLFDEKGYQIPTTLEDLEALMAQMVGDGITPFAIPGSPNGNKVEDTRHRITDYLLLDAGILNDDRQSLHRRERLLEYGGLLGQGAAKVRDWYQAGFFGSNPFAIEREEAQNNFFQGNSGMLWINNNEQMDLRMLEAQTNVEMDVFTFPPPAANTKGLIGYGGMNDGFAAYSKTQYPDESVNILKGLTMMDVQRMWGDNAYSVMCIKDIPYSDPMMIAYAKEFMEGKKYSGGADYNRGNIGDFMGDLLVEFCLTPSMSPDDFETQLLAQRAKVIKDSEDDD